jgi:hypothetical protein
MGTPGRPLTDDEIKDVLQLRAEAKLSERKTAKRLAISKRTVQKFAPAWLVRAWSRRFGEAAVDNNSEKAPASIEK